jgi:hypothetical protein
LVYLNYTTPSELDHKEAVLENLQQTWPIPENFQEQIWRNVDYSNFLVCSFLKTSEDSKMISTGYLDKVNVVNEKWIEETRNSLNKKLEY